MSIQGFGVGAWVVFAGMGPAALEGTMSTQSVRLRARQRPFHSALATRARAVYAERVHDGSIDEASTGGGNGIPLDVLETIHRRTPEAAAWSDVTEYYAVRVDERLTFASITDSRAGGTVHIFSDEGDLLARGSYPVDDEGKISGDVLWRT